MKISNTKIFHAAALSFASMLYAGEAAAVSYYVVCDNNIDFYVFDVEEGSLSGSDIASELGASECLVQNMPYLSANGFESGENADILKEVGVASERIESDLKRFHALLENYQERNQSRFLASSVFKEEEFTLPHDIEVSLTDWIVNCDNGNSEIVTTMGTGAEICGGAENIHSFESYCE